MWFAADLALTLDRAGPPRMSPPTPALGKGYDSRMSPEMPDTGENRSEHLTKDQKRLRLARKLAVRRLQKAGRDPKPEETIRAPTGSEAPPPGTGTYTPPVPYRVFRLVKK